MTFVLDTSVAIPLRDGDLLIIDRVEALGGPLAISVITRVELEGGVYSNPARTVARRLRLDRLLASVPTLAFDDATAAAYGQIVATTGFSRRKVIDRMIAAQAIVHRATLVTLNPDDFSYIRGLSLLGM